MTENRTKPIPTLHGAKELRCPYCLQPIRGPWTEARACGDTHPMKEIPSRVWGCTRPYGHEGEHVACGKDLHELARWPASPGPAG